MKPMGRIFSNISKFTVLCRELRCFCHSQLPAVNLDGTTACNTEQALIRDGQRNLRAPYTRQLQRCRDLWLQVYWLLRAVYGSYRLIRFDTLHIKARLKRRKFIISVTQFFFQNFVITVVLFVPVECSSMRTENLLLAAQQIQHSRHVMLCNDTMPFLQILYFNFIRLTTRWTVRDRIPVGTRFSARPDGPWGPPSLL